MTDDDTESIQTRLFDSIGTRDRDAAAELLHNPVGFVLAVIVGAILGFFEDVFATIDRITALFITTMEESMFEPLVDAASTLSIIPDLWAELGVVAGDLTANLGIFAPIGVVVVWAAGAVLSGMLALAILRVLDTYLPISAIPVIGGLIR